MMWRIRNFCIFICRICRTLRICWRIWHEVFWIRRETAREFCRQRWEFCWWNYQIERIEESYQTASLNKFCEHHNLPCYYVSRLMTQYSPYTFTKYLQRRRILQAAYLLTETDTLIEQIVVEVGYENSSHFHKLFKEEYGMTPKKYREKYDSMEKWWGFLIPSLLLHDSGTLLWCNTLHCGTYELP